MCKEIIIADTNPAPKICKSCSEENGVCEMCGSTIFKYVRIFSKGLIQFGKFIDSQKPLNK